MKKQTYAGITHFYPPDLISTALARRISGHPTVQTFLEWAFAHHLDAWRADNGFRLKWSEHEIRRAANLPTP
jgi:hypothetical protein